MEDQNTYEYLFPQQNVKEITIKIKNLDKNSLASPWEDSENEKRILLKRKNFLNKNISFDSSILKNIGLENKSKIFNELLDESRKFTSKLNNSNHERMTKNEKKKLNIVKKKIFTIQKFNDKNSLSYKIQNSKQKSLSSYFIRIIPSFKIMAVIYPSKGKISVFSFPKSSFYKKITFLKDLYFDSNIFDIRKLNDEFLITSSYKRNYLIKRDFEKGFSIDPKNILLNRSNKNKRFYKDANFYNNSDNNYNNNNNNNNNNTDYNFIKKYSNFKKMLILEEFILCYGKTKRNVENSVKSSVEYKNHFGEMEIYLFDKFDFKLKIKHKIKVNKQNENVCRDVNKEGIVKKNKINRHGCLLREKIKRVFVIDNSIVFVINNMNRIFVLEISRNERNTVEMKMIFSFVDENSFGFNCLSVDEVQKKIYVGLKCGKTNVYLYNVENRLILKEGEMFSKNMLGFSIKNVFYFKEFQFGLFYSKEGNNKLRFFDNNNSIIKNYNGDLKLENSSIRDVECFKFSDISKEIEVDKLWMIVGDERGKLTIYKVEFH